MELERPRVRDASRLGFQSRIVGKGVARPTSRTKAPICIRASPERWGIGLVERGICTLAKKLRENKHAPNDLLECL